MNDPDCIGISGDIPWQLNEQWARLVAKSDTAFFASIKPGILNQKQCTIMQEIFQEASQFCSIAEPLDWLSNLTPEKWLLGNCKVAFNWSENDGSTPDFVTL